MDQGSPVATSPKLRLIALLLAIFFGIFGIHRFYVGKVGTGILMLLITLTFFGAFISGIWSLVDIIMIAAGGFHDKAGNLVQRWTND
jgi:TM2 domain-containing membrane protein YozV